MPRRGIAVAVIVIVACFIVLGLTSDFLVDWAWFSAIGYLNVFWTILGGKALLFFAVFAGSAILLWLNETLAYRFARRRGHVRRVDFEQMASGVETLPELLVPVAHQLYHRRQSDHVPSHHSGPGTETIAPFLRLDRDPYLVISEGRQDWQPLMDTYGRRRRSRQISRSCVGSWSR